jgi:hypothetical protein
MGQRALFGDFFEEILNGFAHVRLDVDDEDFLLITDKESAPAVGWQDSTNLDRHNIILHEDSVGSNSKKTSLRCAGPG